MIVSGDWRDLSRVEVGEMSAILIVQVEKQASLQVHAMRVSLDDWILSSRPC